MMDNYQWAVRSFSTLPARLLRYPSNKKTKIDKSPRVTKHKKHSKTIHFIRI